MSDIDDRIDALLADLPRGVAKALAEAIEELRTERFDAGYSEGMAWNEPSPA